MEENTIVGLIAWIIKYLLTHAPALGVVAIGFMVHYGEKFFRDWCISRGKEFRSRDGQPSPAELMTMFTELKRMFEEHKATQAASNKANKGDHEKLGGAIDNLDNKVDGIVKDVAHLKGVMAGKGGGSC